MVPIIDVYRDIGSTYTLDGFVRSLLPSDIYFQLELERPGNDFWHEVQIEKPLSSIDINYQLHTSSGLVNFINYREILMGYIELLTLNRCNFPPAFQRNTTQ